jgi:hypothetical protein
VRALAVSCRACRWSAWTRKSPSWPRPTRSVELTNPTQESTAGRSWPFLHGKAPLGEGYDAKLGFTFERAPTGLSDLDAADSLPVSLALRTR